MKMQRIRIWLILLMSTMFLTFACTDDMTNHLRGYEQAHNGHDVERALSYLTDDITFEMVGSWIREGKDEMREYEGWDAAINSNLSFRDIRKHGDTIICSLVERNDWFRLVGIDAIEYEWVRITFRNGKISSIVAQLSEQSHKAALQEFQSFISWASSERIYELVELMHGAEFVFRKDNAPAWLKLLQEWRSVTIRVPNVEYEISCSIDPDAGEIYGTQIIRIRNNDTRSIKRLALDWSLSRTTTAEISAGGVEVPILGQSERTSLQSPIFFDLPDPLEVGEEIELEVEFSEKRQADRNDVRLRLTEWHPALFWGFPTHADFAVRIDTDPAWTVVTSGRLDPETGYHRAQDVRSFGLFLGKDMRIIESESGNVLVRCACTPESERCAQLLVETAVDVIGYYRDRFGFYPSSSLSIIPGMEFPAGGYPVATNLVEIHGQGRFDERSELHWKWITAHEIGHQYWGEHVLDTYLEGWNWLMIGLGTYADREYVNTRGLGSEMHRGMMSRYIKGVRRYFDTRANRTPAEISELEFDFNNVVIHGKGFSIISALECALGSDAFNGIYRRCLNDFAGERLGLREFQAVCEDETQQDLAWFFDQWARSNKFLSCVITSQECSRIGDGYESRLQVENTGSLRMPVPVMAYFEDGSSQVKFTNRFLGREVLHFQSEAPLAHAELDPENKLAIVAPAPTVENAILGRALDRLEMSDNGDYGLALYQKAVELNLPEGMPWLRLAASLYSGEYYSVSLDALKRAANYLEKEGSPHLFTAWAWQGHIHDLLGNRAQAISCYEQALVQNVGETREFNQFGTVVSKQSLRKYLGQPFSKPE